jgi:hypothetical protein
MGMKAIVIARLTLQMISVQAPSVVAISSFSISGDHFAIARDDNFGFDFED